MVYLLTAHTQYKHSSVSSTWLGHKAENILVEGIIVRKKLLFFLNYVMLLILHFFKEIILKNMYVWTGVDTMKRKSGPQDVYRAMTVNKVRARLHYVTKPCDIGHMTV